MMGRQSFTALRTDWSALRRAFPSPVLAWICAVCQSQQQSSRGSKPAAAQELDRAEPCQHFRLDTHILDFHYS